MNDFITYGGWIVAILVVVIGAIINRWTASRTKQREIDSTPYELITEWVRRIDAAAFDYFQKASEKQEAWENATYGWESAKAEFNWVMGLVESLNDPDSLYKNLQEHYGYLLKYESIAQSRRNNRSNDSYALNTRDLNDHEDVQTHLHKSSGAIYKELRERRKRIWSGL